MKRLLLKVGIVFGISVIFGGAILGAVIRLTQNPLFVQSPWIAVLIFIIVLSAGIGALACGKALTKTKDR